MQKIKLLIILILTTLSLRAQQNIINSLNIVISNTKKDTSKIDLYEKLGQAYRDEKKIDSSILTYKKALELNEKTNYSVIGQRWELACIDYMLYVTGNYAESLKYTLQELAITEKMKDNFHLGYVHLIFGHNYKALVEYRESLDHYFKAKHFFTIYNQSKKEPEVNTYTNLCISEVYLKINQLDSALMFTQRAYRAAMADSANQSHKNTSVETNYMLYSLRLFGDIYFAKGDDKTALKYYWEYVSGFVKYKENNRDLGFVLNSMAKIFQKRNQNDSAIFYAKKALANAQQYQDQANIHTAAALLYSFYKTKDNYVKTLEITENTSINSLTDQRFKNKILRKKVDSLNKELLKANSDSAKVEIIRAVSQEYVNAAMLDSTILYITMALEFVKKSKLPLKWEIWQLMGLTYFTSITNDYLRSIQYATQALDLSKKIKYEQGIAFSLANIGCNYVGFGDYRKGIEYLFNAKKSFEKYESGHWAIQNIAETYLKMHMIDSALYYNKIAYHIADTGHNQQYMKDFAIRVFANIYKEMGQSQLALNYYRQFINDFYKYDLNNREIAHAYFAVAKLYEQEEQIDSTIQYAKKSLQSAQTYSDQEHIAKSSDLLYQINDSLHNGSLAFKYFKIAAAAKDSMASIEKIKQIQILTFNEQMREKQQAEKEVKEAAKRKLLLAIAAIIVFISSFLIGYRIRQLRLKHKMVLEQKEVEKLRAKHEKDLLALEAKALRAQMNPHFIFNCMNSIKSLIQQHEEEKSVNYLTTFSKLIRTLFNNANKKEISLYDEIETCKLYLQLEAMRFDTKFSYAVKVDDDLDLKSVQVPALIIQPFIENAIWHGIVPKGEVGHVELAVMKKGHAIEISIDDNGIGREASRQNKPASSIGHQSKGVNLTQSRLELDSLLRQRQAKLEIMDKKDEKGLASGTKVIITINEDL